MEPVIASLVYFGCVIVACEILYRIVGATYRYTKHFRVYIIEFIATLQACMCILECGTILVYYGIPGFLVAMTVAGTLIRSTKRGAFVNPAKVIEAALFGGVSYMEAPIRIAMQLAAAYCADRIAIMFWMHKWNTIRVHLITQAFTCFTTPKLPPLLLLGVLGGFACVTDLLNAQCYKHIRSNMAHVVAAFVSALLVTACLDITGVYPQPIFSMVSTLGCGGHWMTELNAICWLGPIIGLIVANGVRNNATIKQRIARAKYAMEH